MKENRIKERIRAVKGGSDMGESTKLENMKKKLHLNDPGYIAFKKLRGILGVIVPEREREERTDEIIARYKRCS